MISDKMVELNDDVTVPVFVCRLDLSEGTPKLGELLMETINFQETRKIWQESAISPCKLTVLCLKA
jgi:hypothetical protein